MGKALRGDVEAGGSWRLAAARRLKALGRAVLALSCSAPLFVSPASARAQHDAPNRLDDGRFTIVHFPRDVGFARTLLSAAAERDTFPGLPRPRQRVLIAVAPNESVFREWVGPHAPEWGVAIAVPEARLVIVHGQHAGARGGDPLVILRHELAHLALHEALGELPPRWFDEGYASYAAGEWGREDALATSVSLVFRPLPALDSLDALFGGGAATAQHGYALGYRAVSELAAMDERRGLSLFFRYWRERGSLDAAIRAAYGITLDDFERQWRARTRRRYGALALTADFALLGLIGGATLLPLWLSRRRRDRRRLEAMRAADAAAEAAARGSVLELLLADEPSPSRDGGNTAESANQRMNVEGGRPGGGTSAEGDR